jgi:hypothetical protein
VNRILTYGAGCHLAILAVAVAGQQAAAVGLCSVACCITGRGEALRALAALPSWAVALTVRACRVVMHTAVKTIGAF